jgi:hypothetical protein
MDIRDIVKVISSSVGNLRGLRRLLCLFGYYWRDIDIRVKGYNADDAVFTLAAASALLLPENQEKLRVYQDCSVAVDVFTRRKGYIFDGEVRHPLACDDSVWDRRASMSCEFWDEIDPPILGFCTRGRRNFEFQGRMPYIQDSR